MNLLRARWTWSFAAALLLAASSCTATSGDQAVDPASTADKAESQACGKQGEMYLTIGDSLELADAFNAELGGTHPVDADGTVFLPALGAVMVAGLTRSEVESLLTEKYGPYFEHTAIKARILPAGKKYYIFGEVSAQGEQPFDGDITVFEAVTKAQPRKDSANLGRVRLIRANPTNPFEATVDLDHLIQTGDSSHNLHVQARDVIYVPAAEPKR